MSWSETGYSDDVQTPAETSDKKLDNSDSRTQDMVHSTTDFLAKFDGEENKVVNACIKEIQADPQLQTGFEKLLQSGISEDIINKIKQELQDGVEFGLDEIILKNSVYSIIEDAINGGFRVYSMNTIAGLVNQKIGDKETAAQKGVETAKMEETAAQKGVETAKMEETAAEDKEKQDEYEIIMEAIGKRKELTEKYKQQNLDEKTNENSDNYKAVKQKLKNNGVLNQLKESGHNEQFINDYILAQTTLLELKFNRSSYEESDISFFDGLVKRLDNACNIPDTSLSSFSPDNIGQTRTEMFNEDSGIGNESLKTARDNNMASHEKDYNEMFPVKIGEEDLISNYGNFLQGELKQFLENYVNNTGGLKNKIEEIQNNENPTEEDKKLLQIYNYMIAELDKNRREAEEQTKKLMEEMCIISQIKGMSMCIGQEEGKDFNLNKANEIINDNGVLTLKGHIDGVDFSVSHDTINPNQRLKIKSKLGVDSEDQNTFEIGKEDNYVNSPFILPSQEEIFGVITKVVQSNDLSKSSDLPKYLESLQNSIIGRMDEVYKDAELAHHYITNKVKGEKILDNSLALIQGIKPNMQDLTKPINQSSNEKLFSFLKMIKFNVENSDTEEKNKLNQCMARIPEIIDAYKATGGTQNFAELKYPPIIENYLKNQTWLENGNEDSKLGLVFDMLSYYNQNSNDTRTNKESNDGVSSKIVINDLYRDLFEFSNNGQSEVGTKRKNENQEKQDKEEAEDVLALNDESIWPPVEYG